MKILITGSRDWTDYQIVFNALVKYYDDKPIIIHGAARGADRISGQIAYGLGYDVLKYPAEWDIYGKSAGPIRNSQMLTENPDIDFVLAFNDDLLNSKGTKDMVSKSIKAGRPVTLFSKECPDGQILSQNQFIP